MIKTYSKAFLLVAITIFSQQLLADDPVYPSTQSLIPPSVGDLTDARKYSDYERADGFRYLQYAYFHRDWAIDLKVDLYIDYSEFIIDLNEVQKWIDQFGYKTHQVAGWPVSLVESTDQQCRYNTQKGHFTMIVIVKNAGSSSEAQKYADLAYKYILPKIPTPPSSESTTDLDTDIVIDSQGEPTIKPKSEYEIQRKKAFKEFEETTEKYIEAENKKYAALNKLYTEGESTANNENFSIAGNVEIVPPRKKLAIFRESDHQFGISLKNNSSYDITKIKLAIYAKTKKGREKLSKSSISFIQKNNLGNAVFRIPHKKLRNLLGDFIELGPNLFIEAEYKIKWSKSYFSSENVNSIWTEAINSRTDGLAMESELAIETPPIASIELVNSDGNTVNSKDVIAKKEYYLKFSIKKDSDNSQDYLMSWDEPKYSIQPESVNYSKWMDTYNLKNPITISDSKEKFNKKINKRFTGKLSNKSIIFYSYVQFPKVKYDEKLKVTIPIKYSYELSLSGNEQYWNTINKTETFILKPIQAESNLSKIVEFYVSELSREKQPLFGLTLSGGQIASFSGEIVWMQPTNKWWMKDLEKWTKLNGDLLEGEGFEKEISDGGKKQLVGELVNSYDNELVNGLSTLFTVKNIVQAETQEEIIEETGKAIISTVVPLSGIMLPLLESAKVWNKRDGMEEALLSEANRGAFQKFQKGTIYINAEEVLGRRIIFKVIDNTMYAIELGRTII